MIIFFGNGGLGNQLYQLRFINYLRRDDEIIVSSSLAEVNELVEIEGLFLLKNKLIKKVINRMGGRFLSVLSKLRIVGSTSIVKNSHEGGEFETGNYIKTKGLLPINYLFPCHCHHEGIFNLDVKDYRIKDKHLKLARQILYSIRVEGKNIIGVHIRRNDYLNYEVLGKMNPSLPIDFFRREISRLLTECKDCKLLIFTDDKCYVEEHLSDLGDFFVSDNSMYVDFALMMKCNYLILSPSTFSYWAAIMNPKAKMIIAPRYWLGWKSKATYPKGFDYKNFELVDVIKDENN